MLSAGSYADVARGAVYPDSVAELIAGLSRDQGWGTLTAYGLVVPLSEPMCLSIFQMKRSGTKYVCANVNYLLEAHKTAEVEKAKARFYRSGRILRDYYTGGSCCVVKSASGLTSEGMAKQQFIVDKELMPKLDMLSKEDTVDYDDQSEDANKLSAKPSAKPSPSTFENGDEALTVQEDDEQSSVKKAAVKKK